MPWIVHTHTESNVHIIRYCHCSQIEDTVLKWISNLLLLRPDDLHGVSISMFQGRIMNKSNEILKTWQSCINKQASLENKYFSFSVPATNSRGSWSPLRTGSVSSLSLHVLHCWHSIYNRGRLQRMKKTKPRTPTYWCVWEQVWQPWLYRCWLRRLSCAL